MGNRQFKNNASSLLAGTIGTGALVVQVASGDGNLLFPSLTGSQYFMVTVEDNSGNIEVMKCTARTADNLTVLRAQEGTTATSFTANLARVELRDTAGTMAAFYQKDGDSLTGDMNLGGHHVTNGVLDTNVQIINAIEVANTPLRGAAGLTANEIVVPADGTRATAGGAHILVVGDPLPVYFIGMVMLWNSAILNIPAGWHLCDGTNGTYDFRDKFVMAGGSTFTLHDEGSTSFTTTSTGAGTPTIDPITLVSANFPVHDHPIDFFGGSTGMVMGAPGIASGAAYFFGGTGPGVRNSVHTGPSGGGTTAPFTPVSHALAPHNHSISGVAPYATLYYIQFIGP